MQVRVAAVTQLGACAAVGALHEVALQDADSQVRRKAAEANFLTLPALLRPVLTPQPEPHTPSRPHAPQVRRKAVAQLLKLRATPALAEAARCDTDVRVREAALEALGELQQVEHATAHAHAHGACSTGTRAHAAHMLHTAYILYVLATHAHAMHLLR